MLIFTLYTFDIICLKTQSSFEVNFGSLCYIGFAKRAWVFLWCLNLCSAWLARAVPASECDLLVWGVAYSTNKIIELFILFQGCLDSLDVTFLGNHCSIKFWKWFLTRKRSGSLWSYNIYHSIMVRRLFFQFERSLCSKLSDLSCSILSLPCGPAA